MKNKFKITLHQLKNKHWLINCRHLDICITNDTVESALKDMIKEIRFYKKYYRKMNKRFKAL